MTTTVLVGIDLCRDIEDGRETFVAADMMLSQACKYGFVEWSLSDKNREIVPLPVGCGVPLQLCRPTGYSDRRASGLK